MPVDDKMYVPPLVEACCDSVHTARAAQEFGAGRVELCGPGDGGTTPSHGLIARCRDVLRIPLHVMIRPHAGGFVYNDDELTVMAKDIMAAKSLGADGIVTGPLASETTINREQLEHLVALARPMKVAFHRAFDLTGNAFSSLETLMSTGVDLVLTSGHAGTALEGADTLRLLQARAENRLTVLAGGRIRGPNVRELVARSHVREVHARCTDPTIVRDVVRALAEPFEPTGSLNR